MIICYYFYHYFFKHSDRFIYFVNYILELSGSESEFVTLWRSRK